MVGQSAVPSLALRTLTTSSATMGHRESHNLVVTFIFKQSWIYLCFLFHSLDSSAYCSFDIFQFVSIHSMMILCGRTVCRNIMHCFDFCSSYKTTFVYQTPSIHSFIHSFTHTYLYGSPDTVILKYFYCMI